MSVELQCLCRTPRSLTLLLADGGRYHTLQPYTILLNGLHAAVADTVVFTLHGLWPDTTYTVEAVEASGKSASLCVTTDAESFSLDVRRFGAVGDGEHDDTVAIQAAILCCPPKGRVLIPRGRYAVSALFLKSHIRLEIAEGATLLLTTDRTKLPVLPGILASTDESTETYLGTWEGNPLDMFAALITGVDVEDVVIYGGGVLDGQGAQGDWWVQPRIKRGAWRGRLLFLCRCKDVTVQEIAFRNSPAWNIHPYFSHRLAFHNITVEAPANSPNTDGFDPESCKDVTLCGAHFSLGDDCIAIKSGKMYMGRTLRTPCENLTITHCLMENGHGGVTIGSEMSGGVRNVTVRDCLMRNTDRGLRIKTRRGRGKDGIIDGILFENVQMEHVGVPCTVNALYFCDPDGHTDYVQSLEKKPVDERTPTIGSIVFRHVTATGCTSCAGYFLGLPEKPIGEIRLEDVTFDFDQNAAPMQPVMCDSVTSCTRQGLVVRNATRLHCKNVEICGHIGEKLQTENVSTSTWEEQT